jgi:hypothetical protein
MNDSTKLYSTMMFIDVAIYGFSLLVAIIGGALIPFVVAIVIAVVYSLSRQKIKSNISNMLERKGNKASAGNFTASNQQYAPSSTFQGSSSDKFGGKSFGGPKL